MSAPFGLLEPDCGSQVRRKYVYAHPIRDSVGLLAGAYYPLKPHICSIVRGSLFSIKTCAQVFTLRLVNPLFHLVVVVVISSLVGLMLVRMLIFNFGGYGHSLDHSLTAQYLLQLISIYRLIFTYPDLSTMCL